MADTFLDNQTVTAEDLNNIAIDLGVADYSHFPETPPQSAVSALNQITADLTGKGVLYTLNMCNVTVSENAATVNTGIIVFENGAKKRITTAQTIGLIPNVDNCIYALNDVANNTIKLIAGESFPTTGDFVKLAKILQDGTVVPMREWSKSKTDTTTQQKYYKWNLNPELGVEKPLPIDIDVGFSTFTSVYVVSQRGGIAERLERMLWDLKEGEKVNIGGGTVTSGYVIREGTVLHFHSHENVDRVMYLKALLVF